MTRYQDGFFIIILAPELGWLRNKHKQGLLTRTLMWPLDLLLKTWQLVSERECPKNEHPESQEFQSTKIEAESVHLTEHKAL